MTQNGTPTPSGPQQVIPEVNLLYKQGQHGARQLTGIEIAGVRFGGIVAVDTGVDISRSSTLPGNVVRLNLETLWPFAWKDEAAVGPDIVVARDVPPIRPGPGFRP